MWLLLFAFLAQPASSQSAALLDRGNQALDAKNYAQAIELFTQAAAADPKDFGAEFQLGLTNNLIGKDREAIPHYEKALTLAPSLYEAQLNLALTLARLQSPAEAIPHFQAAIATKPKEFRPQYGLAQALLAMKDYPAAETAFVSALTLDGRSAPAEAGLGMALGRQNKVDQAAQHFQQAFTLDRTYRASFVELALLYEANQRTEEAMTFFRMFPDNQVALTHLGALLMQAGDAKGAIAPLETAVEKFPTVENRIALAQAYSADKQLAKAQAAVAPAVDSSPKDLELRMFYGRLLRDQRKFGEAAAQFSAVASADPNSAEAWNEYASVAIIAEQYTQGLAALDKVRAMGQESPGNLFYRALAQDHLQQRPQAIESYQKFLTAGLGKFPDQEFQARQRVRILQVELKKRR